MNLVWGFLYLIFTVLILAGANSKPEEAQRLWLGWVVMTIIGVILFMGKEQKEYDRENRKDE